MSNDHSQLDSPETQNEGFDLEYFGRTILANWYWILLSVTVALFIAAICVLRTTPTYTRSARLMIKTDEKNGTSSINTELQHFNIIGSSSNINNEILTICTPATVEEAVRRLRLDVQLNVKSGLRQLPLYAQSPIKIYLPKAGEEDFFSFSMRLNSNRTATLYDFIKANGEKVEREVVVKTGVLANTPVGTVVIQPTEFWGKNFTSEEIRVTKAPISTTARLYAARLKVVQTDRQSTVLDVSLTDDSPARADDLIMKIVEVYNENWLKDRNLVAESTYRFITDRLGDLAVELGDVDKKISDFKSSNLISDPEAASGMYLSQSQHNSEEIFSLNTKLGVAKYIREYISGKSKTGQYLPSNTGIGSTGIEGMISAYNALLSERNDALTNSSAESPVVKKYDNDLAVQRTNILHSLDNLITQLQTEIASWQRNEDKTNAKLANAPQQVKQLLTVSRQQKVKEALYIFLLQKREENELGKTFTAWNSRIIQPPLNAGSNSSQTPITLLIALAVGLALPIGVIYLREMMDHTVRGRRDIDELQIPLIGEIPALVGKRNRLGLKQKNIERAVFIKENSRDLINESFRILRTKLDFFMTATEESPKVILLTSFNPGSGKSLIAANLAKVVSLKDKRVLAVDFDFRHSSLSDFVDTPRHGFTDYIIGSTDNIEDVIIKDGIGENADVLPVGIIPPNPTEILLSKRLKPLFKHLREVYDYIILDCPPIDVVADTNIIKEYTDISLFVVRVGVMDRRNLKEVDRLYTSKIYKHMAMILNGSNYISSRYGNYRYGYSYGYNYGYNYNYGKNFKK